MEVNKKIDPQLDIEVNNRQLSSISGLYIWCELIIQNQFARLD